MRCDVYKQAFEELMCQLSPTRQELDEGVAWISCQDCDGTGAFSGPDFQERCVACKGTGREPVNL